MHIYPSMEKFEEEKYTLFQFMQCLEDILKYIDNFSCEHTIMLDIIPPPSDSIPKTSSLLNGSLSEEVQSVFMGKKQQFLITRRRKPPRDQNEQNITIIAELKIENENQMVVNCSLCYERNTEFQNIAEAANMRDAICTHFNPNLRVFPILHVLVNPTRAEFCPLQPELSRLCLRTYRPLDSSTPQKWLKIFLKLMQKKSRYKKDVLLAVNKDDQLVTWEETKSIEDRLSRVSDPNMKTWDLEPSDPKGILSTNTLLFLSYIIGTINQEYYYICE
jgi:hypothetical protein